MRAGKILSIVGLFSFMITLHAQNQVPVGQVVVHSPFSAEDEVKDPPIVVDEQCGSDIHLKSLQQKYPQRFKSTQEFEQWLQPQIKEYTNQLSFRGAGVVMTIPTIVHIIHPDNQPIGTGENLSHARIKAQIAVLNEDFSNNNARKGNINSVWLPSTGNPEIEFCLATQDPNGVELTELGTNRITYSSIGANASASAHTMGYIDANIKPQTQWDPTKYFNVWVMTINGGVLGYAQFPEASGLGGMPGGAQTASTDGIVCHPEIFGGPGTKQPYHTGQVTTHEVGHWLGLRHVWGDGGCGQDDFCADTPEMSGNDRGCPAFPSMQNACGNPANGTFYFNYMNYVDATCMWAFSNDQVTRMRTVMQNSPRRKELLASDVCAPPYVNEAAIVKLDLPLDSLCTTSINAKVTIKNNGTNNLTTLAIDYAIDGAVLVYNWTGNLGTGQTDVINLPTIMTTTGTHNYTVQLDPNSLNGGVDEDLKNNDWAQSFHAIDGEFLTVSLDVDCFGNEVSWELQETTSGIIYAQANSYPADTGGLPIRHKVCVPKNSCFEFTIDDEYGNGLNGSSIPFLCGIDGDYSIQDGNGNTVVTMGMNPDYGYQAVHQFCLPFNPTLTPDFTGCNTIFTGSRAVFANMSTGDPNITSVYWDFGPNATPSTSTDENPVVTYNAAGTYDVKLVVTNGALKDSIIKSGCMIVNDPPPGMCDTLRNYDLFNGDQLVQYKVFNNWGYFPGHNGMQIKTYAEPFAVNNDTFKVRDIVLHTRNVTAASANSTVKFVIYDDLNGKPNNQIYAYDYPLIRIQPNSANQIYLPNTPLSSDTFYIGFELDYSTSDTLVVETALGRLAGRNTTMVQLENGAWVTASQAIAINTSMGLDVIFTDRPAVGVFTMSDTALCNGGTVDLDASASKNYDNFGWILKGTSPSTSTAQSLSVAYAIPAEYEVKLYVDNVCSVDTITKKIIVSPGAPVADFSLFPQNICEAEKIIFDATSSTNVNEYAWVITGGTPDTSNNMIDSSSFTSTGQFSINLTVSNGCGVHTHSELITVGEAPNTVASADTIVCQGESVTLNASGGTNIVWSTGDVGSSAVIIPENDTVVWVTAGNTSCPADTIAITVLINPIPIIVANAHKTIVKPGENVNFSEFGSTAVTYSWEFGDGDTLGEAVGSHSYASTGIYHAVLRGKFGNCYGYDTVTIIVDRTASIGELKSEDLFELYPNPAHEEIFLNFKNKDLKNMAINIYDGFGRLILQDDVNQSISTKRIDINPLAKGMYQLQLSNSEVNVWSKFIVR